MKKLQLAPTQTLWFPTEQVAFYALENLVGELEQMSVPKPVTKKKAKPAAKAKKPVKKAAVKKKAIKKAAKSKK